MKLIHHLDPYVVHKLNKIRGPSLEPQPKEPAAKRKPGSFLSERDIKDLMDTKKQTYKRVNGRVRGK